MADTNNTKPKTVWILGAGFSRSLGGPLLTDLFSRHLEDELLFWFKHTGRAVPDHAETMLQFYRHGDMTAPGAESKRFNKWSNAEQFLEITSDASRRIKPGTEASYRYEYLSQKLKSFSGHPTLEEIHSSAIKWAAAECHYFLNTSETSDERWKPYVNWSDQLRADIAEKHVVLTFNYDQVLETIPANPFHIMLPKEFPPHGRIPVYKLHGSISWSRNVSGAILESGHCDYAIKTEVRNSVIATPGITKADVVANELRNLWDQAERHLETAHRIVFLGYRFPPSDAESRHRLLGAIRRNEVIKVSEIVLGFEHNPAIARLEQLLHITQRFGTTKVLNMNAEDMIGTFSV